MARLKRHTHIASSLAAGLFLLGCGGGSQSTPPPVQPDPPPAVNQAPTVSVSKTSGESEPGYDLDEGRTAVFAFQFADAEGDTITLTAERTVNLPAGFTVDLVLDANGLPESVSITAPEISTDQVFTYEFDLSDGTNNVTLTAEFKVYNFAAQQNVPSTALYDKTYRTLDITGDLLGLGVAYNRHTSDERDDISRGEYELFALADNGGDIDVAISQGTRDRVFADFDARSTGVAAPPENSRIVSAPLHHTLPVDVSIEYFAGNLFAVEGADRFITEYEVRPGVRAVDNNLTRQDGLCGLDNSITANTYDPTYPFGFLFADSEGLHAVDAEYSQDNQLSTDGQLSLSNQRTLLTSGAVCNFGRYRTGSSQSGLVILDDDADTLTLYNFNGTALDQRHQRSLSSSAVDILGFEVYSHPSYTDAVVAVITAPPGTTYRGEFTLQVFRINKSSNSLSLQETHEWAAGMPTDMTFVHTDAGALDATGVLVVSTNTPHMYLFPNAGNGDREVLEAGLGVTELASIPFLPFQAPVTAGQGFDSFLVYGGPSLSSVVMLRNN